MIGVRLLGPLAAFGGVLFLGANADAQSLPTMPSAAAMTGPPTLSGGTQRFSGNLRGEVSYTSNAAGGDATVAALRGVTPRDVSYDLGTTLNLQLPIARNLVFLSATGDVLRHDKNSVLDANNYGVTGGGFVRLGACSATGMASFTSNQTQVIDLAVAVSKNTMSQDSVNASFSCGRGAFFAGVQGGYTTVSNSASTAGFIDSETGSGSVSIGYQTRSIGNVALSAQYSKTTYDDQAVLLGRPDHFEQYGAGLSYSRRIGLRLSGSASVSWQELKSPATTLLPANTSGNLGSEIALNYRVSSKIALVMGYTLSNQASPTVNAEFTRVENFRLAGTYTPNQRISLHLGGYVANTEYRGGIPAFIQVRNADDYEVDAGVRIKVGRKLAVTLDGIHTDRRADLAAFSYSSSMVTLGLMETF